MKCTIGTSNAVAGVAQSCYYCVKDWTIEETWFEYRLEQNVFLYFRDS